MIGPAAAHAHDTRAALEREAVDVVASDYMLFGPPIAAESAGVPVALIVHNTYIVPEPGKPAPGPGFAPARGPLGRIRDGVVTRALLALFNRGLPVINGARAEYGLTPFAHVLEQIEHVDRVLVLTSAAFDFHGDSHPPHLRYVGPVLTEPEWVGEWSSPWAPEDPRPLVVVGFSSTYMGQEGALARTIEGLSRLDARVLVTSGPAIDPASLPAAENAVVVRSAPHSQLFPQAAAVVTHAGLGTVTRALTADVPLLCMPMGRDQLDVSARVVHAGAGLRLRPGSRPTAIAAAVRRVIAEPAFRAGAARMGEEMRKDAAAQGGIVELEALAAGSA
jgi:MGT family glycosyltransferase